MFRRGRQGWVTRMLWWSTSSRSQSSPAPPLGAGDCERRRPGLVAQPANTLSAAGLLAAGLWIGCRHGLQPRARLLGTVVAAAGVGSAAYHGPGGRGSAWAHDAALAATLGLVPVEDWAALRGWRPARATAAYVATVVATGVLVAARPALTRVVMAALAASAFVAEVGVRRRRPRPARGAEALADGMIAVACLAYAAGRTGGPLCRPDSLLQPHGLWHLLSGAALAAWAEAALAKGTPR